MKKMCLLAVLFVFAMVLCVQAGENLTEKYETSKGKVLRASCDAYVGVLSNLMAQAKQKADLQSYLAIQIEQKRVLDGGLVDEGTTNSIESVASTAKKIVIERDNRIAALLRQYVSQLEALLKHSMLSDKIDEAKMVNEVLDKAKAELATTGKNQPVGQQISKGTTASSQSKKIVLWNTHNGSANNSGTLECNILLYNNSELVWEAKNIQIPWEPDQDTKVSTNGPSGISFNKVRVEVTKWQGLTGGLSEIQVFDCGRNIAKGCFVSASGYWSNQDEFSPQNITDGQTSSEDKRSFWLGRDGTREWVEVDLTKNRKNTEKKR